MCERTAQTDANAEAGPGSSDTRLATHDTGATTADPASSAAAKAMIESIEDPEFNLAMEVLYHGARQSFLAGAHRWSMFAAILFGASAATAFGYEKICGLLAAASATADIAFDFVGRAQVHADIRRRYLEMVAEMSRGEIADFGARWMVISADEPPLYRWASIIAHRNACIALNREVPEAMPVWKQLLAHVWRG